MYRSTLEIGCSLIFKLMYIKNECNLDVFSWNILGISIFFHIFASLNKSIVCANTSN